LDRPRRGKDEKEKIFGRTDHILMRGEGYEINHKKVYRLYREEDLAVRERKKKRVSQPAAAGTDSCG